MDERYCTECRAAIPEGASVCPACGVYAGDVFDGKLPRKRRSRAWWWLALIVVAAAAAWMLAPWPRETKPPRKLPVVRPHVIKDQRDAMTAFDERLQNQFVVAATCGRIFRPILPALPEVTVNITPGKAHWQKLDFPSGHCTAAFLR